MSLPKPNPPIPSPYRRGPSCQRDRREAEHRGRQVILDFRKRTAQQGGTCSEAARCLGLAPRTLRDWNQRSHDNCLKPHARGRPIRRSPRSLRNRVVGFLRCTGPHIGMPTLRAEFSTMPRSELRDMLRRFRRVWQYQNQRLIHRLHWRHPGTVWAADHVQSDRPVDGKYPYVLSVRDLASHHQLAWQPVLDVGADTTIAVLNSLIWEYGPPLVLKTDNGSGFIARDTRKMLAAWSILHLRNPAATPLDQQGPPAGPQYTQPSRPPLGPPRAHARRRVEATSRDRRPAPPPTSNRQSLPTRGACPKRNPRRGPPEPRCSGLRRPSCHQPSAEAARLSSCHEEARYSTN